MKLIYSKLNPNHFFALANDRQRLGPQRIAKKSIFGVQNKLIKSYKSFNQDFTYPSQKHVVLSIVVLGNLAIFSNKAPVADKGECFKKLIE